VILSLQALIEEYTAKHGTSWPALQAMFQATIAVAVPMGSPGAIADFLDRLADEAEAGGVA
jgi:hypothetical protein